MIKDELSLTLNSLTISHPLDGPGAIITSIKFDGKNYELWNRAVTTALMAKNKLGFIGGCISKLEPTTSLAKKNAWNMVNSMITLWILNVVDSKLHTSMAYEDTTHKMWVNIQKRYSVINVPCIHQLKSEIAFCKQGSMELVELYSKLIGLWSELANFIKIPNSTCECTCGKCICDTYRTIIKMMEDDKPHKFLMGLDDDLQGVKFWPSILCRRWTKFSTWCNGKKIMSE